MLSERIRIVALLCLLSGWACGDEFLLSTDRESLQIDPATLAVRSRVEIAAPTGKHEIADLVVEKRSVRWRLVDLKLSVCASVDSDGLTIEFESAEPGGITWPSVSGGAEALILPLAEGSYVPTDDLIWKKYLLSQNPLNTTAGLSMPFFGVERDGTTVTYILVNPFNNQLSFADAEGGLGLNVAHEFTRNNPAKKHTVRIEVDNRSAEAPALSYRKHLQRTGAFVTFDDKQQKTPAVKKLLGAPHIYLWGDRAISRHDIRDFKRLAERLKAGDAWDKLDDESRQLIESLPGKEWVDNYDRTRIAEALSGLIESGAATREALEDAVGDVIAPQQQWGDGWSTTMIQSLVDAGIDRAWLGSPTWAGLAQHQPAVQLAIKSGYLVAPYDSFHSIHSPKEPDTWETAQFDQSLYDGGAVIDADGKPRKGFKQKGYILSPRFARPAIERRVSKLATKFNCNSWFIDCDAFGDVFDDYSPVHPSTQLEDATERVARMIWIRDQFNVAIGSEGGSAYAMPAIHFAHGIVTPGIGWGDFDLYKDATSKYFLGKYYPPDGPAVFFKQVPVKDEHWHVHFDPRFRLPLYELVFHDSVIATHQWGFDSLKFDDPTQTRQMIELLYNVPPLYHLNRAEWARRKDEIIRYYRVFSPLHRELAGRPMSSFHFLGGDRLVQQVTYSGDIKLIANFGTTPFRGIPARSIVKRARDQESQQIFPIQD